MTFDLFFNEKLTFIIPIKTVIKFISKKLIPPAPGEQVLKQILT